MAVKKEESKAKKTEKTETKVAKKAEKKTPEVESKENVAETLVEEKPAKTEGDEEAKEIKAEEEGKKKSAKKTTSPVEKKVVLTPKKYQHGKKYRKIEGEVEKGKIYPLDEAIQLVKKTSTSKFDGTVEIHTNLNIDPSNADHQIRGSVLMPAGLGKDKRVCAVVAADKEKEAKEAGAETVGGQDLVAKIEKGWLDFDVLVATPDMMASLGKLGKVLGTKGLMPNPKTGTVTQDPGKVIADIKKGRAEYKIDKAGSLHSAVGKVSFTEAQLKENLEAYLEVIRHSKPQSVKGTFIKSIYISSTMGPSIKLEK